MGFRLGIDDGRFAQTLHVRGDRLTVGRAPSNDLQLESDGVARRHAMVRRSGDRVIVTDLHSTTGLVVNGSRTERAVLAPGDTVRLGAALITLHGFEEDEDVASAVAPPTAAPPREPPRPRVDDDHPMNVFAARRASRVALVDSETAEYIAAREERRKEREEAKAKEPAPWRPSKPIVAPSRTRVAVVLAQPEFSDLAYQALKSTPWWGLSCVAHVALYMLLLLNPFTSGPSYRPMDADLALTQGEQQDALVDEDETPVAEDDPFKKVYRPEPEFMDLVKDLDLDEAPEEDPLEDLDDSTFRTEGFGPPVEPGEMVVGIDAASKFSGDLGTSFGKADAGAANQSAAKVMLDNPFTRALLRGLKLRTNHKNVRVLKGQYDKCEKIFATLGLEHGWITEEKLSKGRPGDDIKVIIVNCSSNRMGRPARQRLERWVREGGYLLTTDWGIRLVADTFPGYLDPLRKGKKEVMTEDETISFEVHADHRLLKGMPETIAPPRWWLEDSSIPFVVRDKRKVDVLMESKELANRWGSGLVAATFRYGNGRVLHIIGHVYQKEGNLRGAYSMQRLLMNFLYHAIRGL